MTPEIVIVTIILAIIILTWIKIKIWDEPHKEIVRLKGTIEKTSVLHKQEIEKLTSLHKQESENLTNLYRDEISNLTIRLENMNEYNAHIISSEFADIIINTAWREIMDANYPGVKKINATSRYYSEYRSSNAKESMKKRFLDALNCQYKYNFLLYLYPQLNEIFVEKKVENKSLYFVVDINSKLRSIIEIVDALADSKETGKKMIALRNKVDLLEASTSNLTAIPYMAGIMADYETYGIEILAKKLDWGSSYEREKKVQSIREIRQNAKEMVEKNKDAQYKLAYLLSMFPALEEVLDSEFAQLPMIQLSDLSDYDRTKNYLSYLSKDEYEALSVIERNQLALNKYKESTNKTKWQIGRDYELFIGYLFAQKGYQIDYFGSYMGLEDLGRDLIAKNENKIFIIQCKYWSAKKKIHEKHILQLYGTLVSYCLENNISQINVEGLLITNIELSETAKRMAEYLHVKYKERVESGDYPCIKCNIGRDGNNDTKIYHLPFDQQYDSTKISKPGEFFAFTVEEAEKAGFRRAFKWYSSNENDYSLNA